MLPTASKHQKRLSRRDAEAQREDQADARQNESIISRLSTQYGTPSKSELLCVFASLFDQIPKREVALNPERDFRASSARYCRVENASSRARTYNLRFRRPPLYPIELWMLSKLFAREGANLRVRIGMCQVCPRGRTPCCCQRFAIAETFSLPFLKLHPKGDRVRHEKRTCWPRDDSENTRTVYADGQHQLRRLRQ
jgi:hypothetical protein